MKIENTFYHMLIWIFFVFLPVQSQVYQHVVLLDENGFGCQPSTSKEVVSVNYTLTVDLANKSYLHRRGEENFHDCMIVFKAAKFTERLFIQLLEVNINNAVSSSDRLEIFDGDSDEAVHLSKDSGIFGHYKFDVHKRRFSDVDRRCYKSSQSYVTLKYRGTPSVEYDGFRAVITVFQEPNNKVCPKLYHSCYFTNICISEKLCKDGMINCGMNNHFDPSCVSFTHFSNAGYHRNLFIGCAISVVILMVVLLWLGIICIKRSRLINLQRQYICNTILVSPELSDGTVVEPTDIRHVYPRPVCLEPPPIYSRQGAPPPGLPSQYATTRYEMPPPYSVVDTDTASLLVTESSGTQEQTASSRMEDGQGTSTGKTCQAENASKRKKSKKSETKSEKPMMEEENSDAA